MTVGGRAARDRERVMTPATLRRVPNQPKTPMHSTRIPDDLWYAAKATAERRGETLADVIRRALTAYVKRHGKDER